MLDAIADFIKDHLGDSRALSWVVLLGFLLNIPTMLGYKRVVPHLLELPVSSDIGWASLVEYASIALLPIFVLWCAGYALHRCAWKLNASKSDGQQKVAVLTPVRFRWSSGSLGYVAAQVASALFLYANLYSDIFSKLCAEFNAHGITVASFAIVVAALAGLIGLFGSLEYCFVYWKANEADTALDSVF